MISPDKKEIVFHKNALSVIESVVFAHDAERKWIQNHPSVLYETFLIKHAITVLTGKYSADVKIFSYEALTRKVTG